MSAPLGWTVQEADGYAEVAVRGRLDLATAPGLLTALLKCLAEQPDALLVELSALEPADETTFSLFTAVARQAEQWPGTPLLICAPSPGVSAMLERGRYGQLAVYGTIEEGRRAVVGGRAAALSVSDHLPPIAGAVRRARDLATEACAAWDLPDLVGPACLVVSELVSNAVEHAGTMLTVRLTRRSRYLHIAVRDGSPEEPVPAGSKLLAERGRGLRLVESLAAHWGWLPSRDGKVVWATLV
jgi:anti-anti-sigma regulatory factor